MDQVRQKTEASRGVTIRTAHHQSHFSWASGRPQSAHGDRASFYCYGNLDPRSWISSAIISQLLSPSPRKKPFWLGKDYSNINHRPIEDYGDIRAIEDPIEAAVAVTDDYSLGLYGSLVKGCNKSLMAGISTEGIHEWLFREVEIMFGAIKSGVRKMGKDAASGFAARLRDYFEELEISNRENAA